LKVLAILFGAGLVLITSFCLGSLLLQVLKIRTQRLEQRLVAIITGSALLSAIMFALCTVHLVRKWVLLTIAAGSIAAWWRMKPTVEQEVSPALPRIWSYTFLVAFGVFTLFYFFHALAPEISPDGTAYHLAIADHYNRAHGFEKVPTSIYFNISQGGELLFLMAFAFGKHSAAALVHCAFLIMLPWLLLAYGRRFGFPMVGAAAGLLVYASPVFGADGLSAYIDVALGVVVFAMYYLLQIWDQQRDDRLLIPAAILAGFSFSLKYTAFLAAIYCLGFVLWKQRKVPWVMVVIVAAFALPWLIKSWMWVGNPLSPFGNHLFPNPWVHVSFERDYRAYLRHYDLTDMRQLPIEATVKGEKVSGLLGPVFLLLPLSLFALRWRQGRQLLLAGAIMALPYATNVGTRFLIPAAPFFALALGLVVAQWPWLLYSMVAVHLILSFPPMVSRYSGPTAWRVDPKIPFRAALRLESEDSFLRRKWPGYVVDRLIEDHVPPGQPIFLFGATAESYTTRRMLVGFLSAPNETLRDMLWTPIVAGYQPSDVLRFNFPRQTVRKLRVVKTGVNAEENWSIAEFQVLLDGQEIPRAPQWRLTAHPNPWDVQLAFDNNPVTRWKTWQTAAVGDYVQIDFEQPQAVNGAVIVCSQDYTNKQVRIESLDAHNQWKPTGGDMRESQGAVDQNWRLAATSELKARGIRYLLVYDGDLGANDFRDHAAQWGLKKIAEAAESVIYQVN
jgi:hypothetical protein